MRWLRRLPVVVAALWIVSGGVQAEVQDQLTRVRSIYVEPLGGLNGAQLLRDSLIKRLEKSGDFQIVDNKAQAEAVLSGTGTLWVRGYNAMNLRSPSTNRVPVYTGYLSVQLTSKAGEPLWSYMATPGNLGWKTIADDLSATVVRHLAEARDSLSATPGAAGGKKSAPVTLSGAGATFPQPLYQSWFQTLKETRDISVNYSGVGSQEGMRMLAEKKVDFAASEADPSADHQMGDAGERFLKVASVLGGVVPVYNVPDLRDDIHFTAEVLADIYLGKIRRWNDPRIMKWNRGLALPDAAIVVVHRADGSGTTNAWSMFLARNSSEWKMNVGSGLQLTWPTGIGVDGNGGVAKTVRTTKYSIGYVEEVYAVQGQLTSGAVQNRAGEFVRADLESLGLAANSISSGSVAAVGALDPSDKRAYPIATLTWILVPRQVDDAGRKSALGEMLRWALTSGQKACSALGYVPLPKDLAHRELQKLEQWQ
jgi:phosphate transport system substrate-binding protein